MRLIVYDSQVESIIKKSPIQRKMNYERLFFSILLICLSKKYNKNNKSYVTKSKYEILDQWLMTLGENFTIINL